MSYTFRQNMVPSSKYSIKCPYSMSPQYITIHNTSNSASADAEVRYMISNNNQVSYHVCVDEREVIQAIPFNRNAWHAGDGASGTGNRKSIGIEIARSTGDANLFEQAERNCAAYVAKLLKERGWGIDRVKRHKDWSGKYCPHKTMDKGWQRFLNMIQAELNKSNQPVSQPTNNGSWLSGSNFQVRIKETLNIRKTASFDAPVVGQVHKHDVYTIISVENGLGKLKSGVGYISMNTKYVEKVETAQKQSFKEYKVRVTADSLNVRKQPTTASNVATVVHKGQVFTIVGEENGFLKLKSGAGWISKNYVQKL